MNRLPVVFLLLTLSVPLAAQQMPGRAMEAGSAHARATTLPGVAGPLFDFSATTQLKRAAPAQQRGGALRVGSTVELDATAQGLDWTPLEGGGFVARLSLRSAGAAGLRARLLLPRAAAISEVQVQGGAGGQVEVVRPGALQEEVWTPYTEGDTQVIALVARQAGPADVAIAAVSHFDVSMLTDAPATLAKESSGSCNPDVACPTGNVELDAALAQRKKSVTRIVFSSGGSSFQCTATLINSDRFPRPYLLTANHCIGAASEAASITTFWFRENSACGNRDSVVGQVQVAGGTQLSFTNGMADSTLLEMNQAPPAGTVFAGWNAGRLTPSTPIVSVSHPRGDPMKYARGSLTTNSLSVFDLPYRTYGVTFTQGVTEGGSSGSGLFTLSPTDGLQLRGILSGTTLNQPGGLSCTNLNELGIYGSFEVFHQNIQQLVSGFAVPAVDIDANQPSGARILAPGSSLTGRIDYAGDLDVFRIDVTQAGTLSVRTTGGNDLVGALLDAQGSKLKAEDDVEIGNNEFGITWRVSPGTYYVSIGHFAPGATSTDYQVSAAFSTATDNFSDIWFTQGEDGWGIQINHQDNIVFAAIYTYDAAGNGMWLITSRGERQPDGSYLGDLFRARGPAFNSLPWPSSQVALTRVGTLRLTFQGTTTAQLSYSVDGVTVNKALSRFRYSTPTSCSFSAFDRTFSVSNVSDLWWTAGEDGWGLNIIQQGNILFVTLYSYDAAGNPLWLIMSRGDREGTARRFTGQLFRARGPVFNSTPWPGNVALTLVGNMTLSFSNGNSGTLTYTVDGVTVNKQIQRFTFGALRPDCETAD